MNGLSDMQNNIQVQLGALPIVYSVFNPCIMIVKKVKLFLEKLSKYIDCNFPSKFLQ